MVRKMRAMNDAKSLIAVLAVSILLQAAPVGAQDGGGAGAGDGTGPGDGKGIEECGVALSLFRDDERIWALDSDGVAALPYATTLKVGHRPDSVAIPLKAFATALEAESAMVEVTGCGGRIERYEQARITQDGPGYFIVINKRGEFKLVQVNRRGREDTLVRRAHRITISP